jgi:cell division protease FtsH
LVTTATPPEKQASNQRLMSVMMLAFVLYYLSTFILQDSPEEIAYSAFVQKVELTQVESVLIKGRDLRGRYGGTEPTTQAGQKFDFHVVIPELEGDRLLALLEENQVVIEVRADQPPFWLQLLSGFLPWILIIGFFFWSSRALTQRLGGSGGLGGIGGFGRSRARRHEATDKGPGFADVAGVESAKDDLREIVDYLKDPEKYRKFGADIPRGVLMMGAPGTGKTLLARACATEAGVPFFSVSGSEFIEMYVGIGASRVRDMFATARQEAPALVFIDEIDSVGRVRGTGLGGGNDEREQTLNQILAEMDGFEAGEAVIVLAATNRPDVLDPALLRPGRFDRKVTLDLPQRQARAAILAVHCRDKPLSSDVNLDDVAATTIGFSGADLANLVNEAALSGARNERASICQQDFMLSRDKVLMGAPRADLLNPSERERVACHEAGHAIAAAYCANSDPLERVSILPRGRALGITEQMPVEDRHNITEDFLQSRLAILLAGRCAERLRFGTCSTGAEDDLKQATRLAYKMVGQWGMTEKLGAVGYSLSEEHPFLGREISQPREFGEDTAKLLDEEVRHTLQQAEQVPAQLLEQHRQQLDAVIAALLDHETLQRKELEALLSNTAAKPEAGP